MDQIADANWGVIKTGMRSLVRTVVSWFSDDSEAGVTAIEYALLAALIALVIVGSVTTVGTNLKAVFTRVSTSISSATHGGGHGGDN